MNLVIETVGTKHTPLQSLVTFRNSQGEAARGTLLKLERSVVVFEVYNPYSILQLSEVLEELTVRRGSRIIYQGRAVVSNLVNTGLMLIVSATFLGKWSQVPEFHGDLAKFREEAEAFVAEWSETLRIRHGYRIVVSELCSYLIELSQWMDQVDAVEDDAALGCFRTYDKVREFTRPMMDVLTELMLRFEQEARVVGEDELPTHKAFLQRQLHPLVMRAPFPYRTFHKPLGYAGDYEMMNMIHRDQPEGPNFYSRFINAAYVGLPIAECVRNRAAQLEQHLIAAERESETRGKPLRIISIGCGPAVEVQRFLSSGAAADGSEICLLDFNEETLSYARRQVEAAAAFGSVDARIRVIHESVHGLLKSALISADERFSEYDFVYCAGLFDYLSDKICGRLVRLFFGWLRRGGVLLVTNMHTRNPHRYMLEHGGEWYLIHRDEQQMLGLAPTLGSQRTFTDTTGINLCLEIRKDDRGPVAKQFHNRGSV